MESNAAAPPSVASPFPTLPPINSFSSCFLALESLRSTTAKIQRSLLAHYGDLCRSCETNSLNPKIDEKNVDVKKIEKEGKREAKKEAVDEIGSGDHSGTRISKRKKEVSLKSDDEALLKSDDDVAIQIPDDAEMKGSFEDDGGIVVEDDFLQPPPATPPKDDKIASTSDRKSSQSSKKTNKKDKGEKSSTATDAQKRKREDGIDRMKKRLKRMQENQAEKDRVEGKFDDGETDEEDEDYPLPPLPECINSSKLSAPKLRNYRQIAKVLHRELGDANYKDTVNR